MTGSIVGIGTVCFEIYQPRDESPVMAYLSELQDAIDLADVPWHYMASIFWQWLTIG